MAEVVIIVIVDLVVMLVVIVLEFVIIAVTVTQVVLALVVGVWLLMGAEVPVCLAVRTDSMAMLL